MGSEPLFLYYLYNVTLVADVGCEPLTSLLLNTMLQIGDTCGIQTLTSVKFTNIHVHWRQMWDVLLNQ